MCCARMELIQDTKKKKTMIFISIPMIIFHLPFFKVSFPRNYFFEQTPKNITLIKKMLICLIKSGSRRVANDVIMYTSSIEK